VDIDPNPQSQIPYNPANWQTQSRQENLGNLSIGCELVYCAIHDGSVMSDDDDDLVLSSAAQSALAEFLAEKEAQETSLLPPEEVSIDDFPEDWQVRSLLQWLSA
jgi:hypothetical protein